MSGPSRAATWSWACQRTRDPPIAPSAAQANAHIAEDPHTYEIPGTRLRSAGLQHGESLLRILSWSGVPTAALHQVAKQLPLAIRQLRDLPNRDRADSNRCCCLQISIQLRCKDRCMATSSGAVKRPGSQAQSLAFEAQMASFSR